MVGGLQVCYQLTPSRPFVVEWYEIVPALIVGVCHNQQVHDGRDLAQGEC